MEKKIYAFGRLCVALPQAASLWAKQSVQKHPSFFMTKKTNRLGPILDRLFLAKGLSLHQAGSILGQHHTVLSTVTRGASHLSRKNLEILLKRVVSAAGPLELSQAEAFELAISLHCAWLEEQILPVYQDSVTVIRKGKSATDQPVEPRAKAIAYFDKLSKGNPAVAEWLVATHQVMEQNMLHGKESSTRQAKRRPEKSKR